MPVRPEHITIEEASASLSPEYQPYYTLNAARNLFLIKAPPEKVEEFRHDLSLIDTPPPHILVDLLAVELTDEANRDLGLDWTYTEGRFGFFQPSGNAIRDLVPESQFPGLNTFPGAGQSFYQGVGKLEPEFFVRLNTLVRDGEGTILANPRTVSMSGKQAKIQITKVLNYFFTEGFDTSGRPIVKKSDISADTIGQITPVLLPDGRIHLVIEVSVGTFTFSPDAGLPERTSRVSETEVIVREGESLVIGGLRQQKESRTKTRVPILGYIPYLKPLFTRTEVSLSQSVLTIFITPQVVREDQPMPQWPILDPEENRSAPILRDGERRKTETTLSGMPAVTETQDVGWFRRLLGRLGI